LCAILGILAVFTTMKVADNAALAEKVLGG